MIAIISSTTPRASTGQVPTTQGRKILMPTAIGRSCRTTDRSGCPPFPPAGFRIVTAAGFGSPTTAGLGFRLSRGAGLLITMDGGSIRTHLGYGGRDQWEATDTEGATIDRSGLPPMSLSSDLAAELEWGLVPSAGCRLAHVIRSVHGTGAVTAGGITKSTSLTSTTSMAAKAASVESDRSTGVTEGSIPTYAWWERILTFEGQFRPFRRSTSVADGLRPGGLILEHSVKGS
jgi:hypothetical protein